MPAMQPDGRYRGRPLTCEVCGSPANVFVVEIIGGYAYPEDAMRCDYCAGPLEAWSEAGQ